MIEILSLNEAKQALRLDNNYLDDDIQSSIYAATYTLQELVGFPDDYVFENKFLYLAKTWIKEWLKTNGKAGGAAYFPDYDNSDGLNIMTETLQNIYAGVGTL